MNLSGNDATYLFRSMHAPSFLKIATFWDDFKLPEISKTSRKKWFQWPHHATPKKDLFFLIFILEIHRFHWSQASHHVRQMMQPVRVKTSFATLWHDFKLPEISLSQQKTLTVSHVHLLQQAVPIRPSWSSIRRLGVGIYLTCVPLHT